MMAPIKFAYNFLLYGFAGVGLAFTLLLDWTVILARDLFSAFREFQ
jgi:hypothetical protein